MNKIWFPKQKSSNSVVESNSKPKIVENSQIQHVDEVRSWRMRRGFMDGTMCIMGGIMCKLEIS